MARSLRILLPLLLACALGLLPDAAFAHGHGGGHGGHHGGHGGGVHSHVFLGFGCCGYWPGYYYPAYDPYYYGYPAYPADPYAYSAPAAVYQAPAANCRQFNGNATVDASGQPFYGTACLGSDGLWHITGQ
ncbi:MAG: hypothetical protein JO128_13775 [Alphaproteobacteria bacterium]|nr:hypothetical protein [Alphaproteobacteria bacterium]